MKKQIDPSLNSNDSENILFGTKNENEKEKSDSLSIEKQTQAAEDEISFILNENGSFTVENEKSDVNVQEHHHSSHHSSSHHHSHHGSSGHHSSHHSSSHHHSSGSNSSHHHSSHSSGSHNSHSHSHHSSKKKKKKMPVWAKVVISLVLIFALLAGGTGSAYFILLNQGKNDLTSVAELDKNYKETISYNGHNYQYNTNLINIAFMGIDERYYEVRDALNLGCADADMLAVIDTQTGEMKVISLPRDTMVDIDIYSDNGVFLTTKNVQLTLSYSYGDGGEQSCKNVTKAMSRILYGVPIDKYFALNLEGIKPINDAVGGVTLTALYDIPNAGITKGKEVTLKCDMAEAYVRSRDMDRATAAYERGERQMQYVKAFANQVLGAVKSDFNVVSDLYNTATKYSQTNITLNNATYLAQLMLSKNITGFESYSLKGETTLHPLPSNPEIINAQFVPDEDALMELVLEVFYTQID